MSDKYDHLREFYKDFSHYQEPARRVAWRTHEGQCLRFETLLEAIDDADFPVSILDVGCGVGSLYGYLQQTGRLGEYLGIDLLPDMVELARASYPNGHFEVSDLLKRTEKEHFDLVVCSGSLNVLVQHHESWVKRMLKAMWERANLAVAVNFQTTRAYQIDPTAHADRDLFHGDLPTLLSWCGEFTSWTAVRQDYLGSDAAFYLYNRYHRSGRRLQRWTQDDHRRSKAERATGLAWMFMERKLPEVALALLEAVEETPDVLNYIGLCHHRMGNHRKARKYYEDALKADPRHEEAQLNLDWILRK